MDFSKVKSITIPEGVVTKIVSDSKILWQAVSYKNWARYSTESDGKTIYNGGKGYKDGYRIRSGGAETTLSDGVCTGFIRVNAGDVVRITGWNFTKVSSGNAINVADSSFSNIGQLTSQPGHYGIFTSGYSAYGWSSVVEESEGVWKWIVPPSASGVVYIRVSGYDNSKGYSSWGADMVITVNEEITK